MQVPVPLQAVQQIISFLKTCVVSVRQTVSLWDTK
jgi:hypothetical protein